MASNGFSSNHSPITAISSPWSQIVASSAKDSDVVSDSNGMVKSSVWNKPSNEDSSSQINPFISADSWPPLSQSTKASAKLPSQSAKPLMDPSSSQVTGNGLPSPQKEIRDNVSLNHVAMSPQRSVRHSYSNQSSNGGHPPPQLSVPQGSMTSSGSRSNNSSPMEQQPRMGLVLNGHTHQRNSYRNRNGGPHHHRDGFHHHNYGRRRDQDRGNNDWYTYRNFNGIDNYIIPRYGPRFSGPLPPPASAIYPSPPIMQPFGSCISFPADLQHPIVYGPPPPPALMEPLGAIPVMRPPPTPAPRPTFGPCLDPELHSKIVKQVEYYFSKRNLVTDEYLRRQMDHDGWVHINLVAGFNKVKQLTNDVNIVLNALRTSLEIEVQGDKIRKQGDWEKWLLPPRVQSANVAVSEAIEKLADQIQILV